MFCQLLAVALDLFVLYCAHNRTAAEHEGRDRTGEEGRVHRELEIGEERHGRDTV